VLMRHHELSQELPRGAVSLPACRSSGWQLLQARKSVEDGVGVNSLAGLPPTAPACVSFSAAPLRVHVISLYWLFDGVTARLYFLFYLFHLFILFYFIYFISLI